MVIWQIVEWNYESATVRNRLPSFIFRSFREDLPGLCAIVKQRAGRLGGTEVGAPEVRASLIEWRTEGAAWIATPIELGTVDQDNVDVS